MNKREFERELFIAIEGFFGGADWTDRNGRSYTHVMDDLVNECSNEQWLIVDLTLDMVGEPDFITGEVPCDTPVSPNEWDWDYNTPLDTPITGYQKPAPLGWWFCIEDLIPQQMTAEQAFNYTGPFATERDAFIAVILHLDAHLDSLVAELELVRERAGKASYSLPVARRAVEGE